MRRTDIVGSFEFFGSNGLLYRGDHCHQLFDVFHQGCVRCGGAVYEAEKREIKDEVTVILSQHIYCDSITS